MDDAAPRLSLAFELEAEIGPAVEFGETGGGLRRMVPILGGKVTGRLQAEVIPGGADWQTIRPNGVTDLWARYALRAADGGAIVVTNLGVRRASAAVSARLAAGERVDPSEYYFRSNPAFVEHRHKVWSLLHDEVRRAQAAGHAKIQPDGTAPDETRTITTGKAA